MTSSPSGAAPSPGFPGVRNQPSFAANSEADGVRQLMNRLFSMLSHDLRTPLSAISGWLFLLESDKLDAAARKRALAKIRANIDDQVHMIDDALLLSRCNTGHVQLDLALISSRATLSAALESTAPAAVTAGIHLNPPAPGQDAIVLADAGCLRRVFELLLSNAVSSMPAGGTVDTAVQPRDQCVEISIADHGEGFGAAALPYVFDPFDAPDNSSRVHGQGAKRGLLLASALVAAHGGRLTVNSPGEGLGATFTAALPSPPAPNEHAGN